MSEDAREIQFSFEHTETYIEHDGPERKGPVVFESYEHSGSDLGELFSNVLNDLENRFSDARESYWSSTYLESNRSHVQDWVSLTEINHETREYFEEGLRVDEQIFPKSLEAKALLVLWTRHSNAPQLSPELAQDCVELADRIERHLDKDDTPLLHDALDTIQDAARTIREEYMSMDREDDLAP